MAETEHILSDIVARTLSDEYNFYSDFDAKQEWHFPDQHHICMTIARRTHSVNCLFLVNLEEMPNTNFL